MESNKCPSCGCVLDPTEQPTVSLRPNPLARPTGTAEAALAGFQDVRVIKAGETYDLTGPMPFQETASDIDVKVIAVKPESRKLPWTISMRDDDEGIYDITDRAFQTDVADSYRTTHACEYEVPNRRVYTVIPILEFLWGKPWDNLALNYFQAFKPSAIRVHKANEPVTCDAWTGRVSVLLEEDDRTIHRIEMEADCGGIGVNTGSDLSQKTRTRQVPTDPGKGPLIIANTRAIAKLNLFDSLKDEDK